MTIHNHITNNEEELKNPMISPQRRRHILSELNDLLEFREAHPNSDVDPTSLELFCYFNPDALECRMYNV